MAPVSLENKPASGVPYFMPAQDTAVGTALDPTSAPTLFQPLRIRSVELQNRLAVSPMCMYSADDGHLTDYHLVHLGQFALHGAALTFVEATSVEPRGRISPEDSGIWSDSHVAPLRRVNDFVHGVGGKTAIQLAHAGRKASTLAPWISGRAKKVVADKEQNGWPGDVVGPSAVPFSDRFPMPKELTVEEIHGLVQKFADAAVRSVKAGFDMIEIHGAHGYLVSEFLSPISNQRTDDYGGSFENRIRFLVDVIKAIRAVIPDDMPLWVRISATEWMEWTGQPSWDIEQSKRLAKLLPDLGVDVLDVSSGGNNSEQRIELHQRYQTDLAGEIRRAVQAEGRHLLIATVGSITEAEMARSLVQEEDSGVAAAAKKQQNGANGHVANGNTAATVEVSTENGTRADADLVLAARQFLREPEWPLRVAHELNVAVQWPSQYHRANHPLKGKF